MQTNILANPIPDQEEEETEPLTAGFSTPAGPQIKKKHTFATPTASHSPANGFLS